MNKVILIGRLTRDPEVRYAQGPQPKAVCNYSLAVNRSYHREGEPEADFINVVAFDKRGEWAGKYFQKGQQVAVVGELRIENYTDRDGVKRLAVKVIASEQHFADSKRETNQPEAPGRGSLYPPAPQPQGYSTGCSPVEGFDPVDEDDDIPF